MHIQCTVELVFNLKNLKRRIICFVFGLLEKRSHRIDVGYSSWKEIFQQSYGISL